MCRDKETYLCGAVDDDKHRIISHSVAPLTFLLKGSKLRHLRHLVCPNLSTASDDLSHTGRESSTTPSSAGRRANRTYRHRRSAGTLEPLLERYRPAFPRPNRSPGTQRGHQCAAEGFAREPGPLGLPPITVRFRHPAPDWDDEPCGPLSRRPDYTAGEVSYEDVLPTLTQNLQLLDGASGRLHAQVATLHVSCGKMSVSCKFTRSCRAWLARGGASSFRGAAGLDVAIMPTCRDS